MGIAYSLAFIPTFEAILDAVIDGGGCDDLASYSLVSGWWSSITSLGEVTGSAVGGIFMDVYGFVEGANIMAFATAIAATIVGLHYLVELIIETVKRKRIADRRLSKVSDEIN